MVRRVLVVIALALATLAGGPVATAAPGTAVASTERFVEADWAAQPVAAGDVFTQRQWGAALTVRSMPGTAPVTTVSAGVCTLVFADAALTVFRGGSCTSVRDATSGFSSTYANARLSAASVRGAHLPAQTCALDADFNQVGACASTSLSVDVAWVGDGPIQTDTSVSASNGLYRTTSVLRQRGATAVGTFDDEPAVGEPFHTGFFDATTRSVTHSGLSLLRAVPGGAHSGPTRAAVGRSSQTLATADRVGDMVTVGTRFTQRASSVLLSVDSASTPAASLTASTCDYTFDAAQVVTGVTCTLVAEVGTGFGYSMGQRLASASVHAVSVPAARCTFDADFTLVGACTTTSMSVDAVWTGQGVSSTSTATSSVSGSFRSTTTQTMRNAVATVSFDGAPASAASAAQLLSIVDKVVTH